MPLEHLYTEEQTQTPFVMVWNFFPSFVVNIKTQNSVFHHHHRHRRTSYSIIFHLLKWLLEFNFSEYKLLFKFLSNCRNSKECSGSTGRLLSMQEEFAV